MTRKAIFNAIVVLTISATAITVYHCKNPKLESGYYAPKPIATHFNGEDYVGSVTCMECHSDIYKTHIETAHFRTSAVASGSNMLGSFEPGSNILDLEYVKFTMRKQRDSFYQYTELKNRTAKIPPSTFDVVIGSGVRGQSYATWKKDRLFQLQPSYHAPSGNWVNSPGYPNYADNDRPVRDACLKCHVTFAENLDLPKIGNRYDSEGIIYGIDCERCHGPSRKHVVHHRKNTGDPSAKFMLYLDSLPRQQRLDVCAQCHSGPRDELRKGNSFSFLPGELLEEYAKNTDQYDVQVSPDVHGNQYGLLTASKCFKKSSSMDCTTCHDPHRSQRGDSTFFNGKCTQCHSLNQKGCSETEVKRTQRKNNCIDCHMPLSPSETMTVRLNRTDSLETSFKIRSHLIAIYGEKSH